MPYTPPSPVWIDYSATTTLGGFSATTIKLVQYMVMGKVLKVTYQIHGTGTGTTSTFTLPFSASTFQDYSFIVTAVNNGTIAAAMIVITSGSATVTCYANGAAGNFTNATPRILRGVFEIPIP